MTKHGARGLLAELAAADDAALWWRVSITLPGGRTIEVDTPSDRRAMNPHPLAASLGANLFPDHICSECPRCVVNRGRAWT